MTSFDMAKKKRVPESVALHVRDDDLSRDLDTWAEKLNAGNPDAPQWNRASVARAALRRALRERGESGGMP